MAGSGKVDEMKGRMRSAIGEVTDDDELKRRGALDKASGKVKEGVEKVREKVEHLMDNRDSERNKE